MQESQARVVTPVMVGLKLFDYYETILPKREDFVSLAKPVDENSVGMPLKMSFYCQGFFILQQTLMQKHQNYQETILF